MKKEEVLRRITACGLVAVVRAASGEEAKRITSERRPDLWEAYQNRSK